MKKYIVVLICLFIGQFYASSQILDPVKWSTSVEKISDTEYKLIAKATIDSGWHLYSQDVPEGGPIATTFTYDDENGAFKIVGNTSEEEGHTVDDPVFEMKIKYFENTAIFEQKIEVLKGKTTMNAFVEYMACDDKQCTAPTEVDLVFNLPMTVSNNNDVSNSQDNVVTETVESDSSQSQSKRGLWRTFIIAFLFGFTALLTPCVFPMIPLTVSFFTKQSKNKAQGIRNAIIYGISIVVIYVLLGVVVSAIFGPSALNALATNVWFNIIFFLLLIVFAVSFLGAFEIMLPQSWANKIDAKSNKSGLVGIFFMALALAIVSFSCTGPIVGTILVEAAAGGDKIGPIIGMLGFSLAIALHLHYLQPTLDG